MNSLIDPQDNLSDLIKVDSTEVYVDPNSGYVYDPYQLASEIME